MVVNSTTDIVNALVSKGVLTEEEGALLTKGRTDEAAGQAKALKKAGKVTVSDAIDNAKVYGDIRARYERRDGDVVSNNNINSDSNRARYKITLGVETTSGQWYSDLALALSSNGRSDNVSMGDGLGIGTLGTSDQGAFTKEKNGIYLKRAMFGYKPTEWLAVEAGRMKNPLYMVNAMVFDHDIVMEGAQEKLKYKFGDTNVFANLGQWVYTGGGIQANDTQGTTGHQNLVLAFQVGAQNAFIDNKASIKAAIGDYNYTTRGKVTSGYYKPVIDATDVVTTADQQIVNNLNILDIPAEINYMAMDGIGTRLYGEYANNTDSDRYNIYCANNPTHCGGNDDKAWLVGFSVGSAKDLKSWEGKKMAKGDWFANLWYQDTGAFALDPNAVDTDIFDGRLNMKGTTLKAQYNATDNVLLNFTGGWATRKNDGYGTTWTKADLNYNLKEFELYQFDVTYKF